MLVLSRKPEQKIQIGENVVITILEVKGSTVRIGIEAPRSVRVLRGELAPMQTTRPVAEAVLDAATLALPTKRDGDSQPTSLRQILNDRRGLQFADDRDGERPNVRRFPVAEAAVEVRSERLARPMSPRVRTTVVPR